MSQVPKQAVEHPPWIAVNFIYLGALEPGWDSWNQPGMPLDGCLWCVRPPQGTHVSLVAGSQKDSRTPSASPKRTKQTKPSEGGGGVISAWSQKAQNPWHEPKDV